MNNAICDVEKLCRNCGEPQEFHCTECNACNATPAYTDCSIAYGVSMKYPQHCYNENYCEVADRYEGIVAKRREKLNYNMKLAFNK